MQFISRQRQVCQLVCLCRIVCILHPPNKTIMRIGIDFGTTHTSAAIADDGGIRFIPLDPHNPDPHILRSMIYVDRAHNTRLGLDAVETFLAEDTAREVVYEERVVGTIENTVAQTSASRGPTTPDGPITIVYDVIIDEDVGARGRLLQSIKTGLRSAEYEGTEIFGRYFSVQELVSLILQSVRTRAEDALQHEVREALIGRPVKFADDAAEDQLSEDRLRAAAELAGFRDITFAQEPIAAALFYLNDVHDAQTILVFDFGGGTLDLTVMRAKSDGAKAADADILATRGVLIGGDDLDSRLMEHHVAPYFGTKSTTDVNWDGRKLFLGDRRAQLLYRWQTIPVLSREDNLKVIEQAMKYGEHPDAFAALNCLVTQNYGFPLFERIEQAKRILSDEKQAPIQMQVEAIELDTTVTRRDFNLAIGNEVADIRTAVREVVKTAEITPADIDVVVTTGGSSAIPMFQSMLKREFPDAQFVQSDTFGSVTGGLALLARDA